MRRFVAVLAISALLAGCADLHTHAKDSSRDETLGSYGSTLRFGDFASAWQFVDPKIRADHPLDAAAKKRYNAVQVGGYETDGPIAVDANTVKQTAQISLIVKSSQTSYDIVDHQVWKYDPVTKHWWLESGLPDITPEQ
ncbi:MAG TPA: hypothetical protein VFP88_00650 [Rhodanobacteraceae bacterium]|nr:hypothetical protein [Rhodanobacteraceae bacterium]